MPCHSCGNFEAPHNAYLNEKNFHPKSNIQPERRQVRLDKCQSTVLNEIRSNQEYINKMARKNELMRECLKHLLLLLTVLTITEYAGSAG